MRIFCILFAALGFAAACHAKDDVAIVAHRGFWNNESAVHSQNSIAALSLAQSYGFWGSECDIHLTSDNEIIVNHDEFIDGLAIADHTYAELSGHRLGNGEKRPTFDEYLDQCSKSRSTVLVVELKPQGSDARDEALVRKALERIKAHRLYKPGRVAFISFSYYICRRISEIAPGFINQYLNGDKTPEEVAADGINGIDYEESVFVSNPDWIERAHKLNMSVNVWTVNSRDDMQKFIDAGVDAITTNNPLELRELLGTSEKRKAKAGSGNNR